MVIYRTLANPAYLDLRIDQSNRRIGSIFSPTGPIIGNYGPLGLARTMTPRAWLSTWSGLSSQADLPDSIQHVTIPTLIVYGRRLRHLPSEAARVARSAGRLTRRSSSFRSRTTTSIQWATKDARWRTRASA